MKKKRDRPLDQWRKFAALPLPEGLRLSGDRDRDGANVWTLEADGGRVQWREADAPGLADVLVVVLSGYHGAWHLARTELGVVKKKKRGGDETAKQKRADAERRNKRLIIAARKLRTPGMTTRELADQLAERGYGGRFALRKKLPKLPL